MEHPSDRDHHAVIPPSAAPRKNYNIVAATTALVVFALLAYALTQIVVKLNAGRHRRSYLNYKSTLLHGGTLLSVMDRDVVQYLNLRYAMVPERFSIAEPYAAKHTEDEAHEHPRPCAQSSYSAFPSHPFPAAEEFEDCLFLNVWSPFDREEDESSTLRPDSSILKPVVVVLVGGNFVSGGSSHHEFFDGAVMASLWNQVIVIPNYRVGLLGFYNLRGENTSRNAGFADQVLVLQWVQSHIAFYGGDPNKVTLLGHEAGATAVGFHLLSPESSPLFVRAILLSGSPYRLLPRHANTVIRDISHELLCSVDHNGHDTTERITSCLRSKSLHSLVLNQREATLNGAVAAFSPSFPHITSADNGFTFYGNSDRASKHLFENRRKSILVGTTENEGSAYTSALLNYYGVEHENELDNETAAHILEAYLKHHGVTIGEDILGAYMRRNDSRSVIGSLARAIGDFAVHCPVRRFLESYARTGPGGGGDVYVYHFRHVPDFRWWPNWMGAPQMLDWLYVSGNVQNLRLGKITVADTEILLSKKMASLLSCFAAKGDPVRCRRSLPVRWTKLAEDDFHTLVVENDSTLVMRSGLPYGEACRVWDAVFAHVAGDAVETSRGYASSSKGSRVEQQRMK
ncbi:hypothetical protein V5799_013395, partial [Amblyomma americanum]